MKPRIAILSYNTAKYSETFIANQVKHLPADVHYLSGGEIPQLKHDGTFFLPQDKWSIVKRNLLETLLGQSLREHHLAAVEHYLVSNKIQAVLANFSITALPVMDICKRNNIPLVVHFHGWTAYRSTVLEQYGHLYPQLFETAAAIIGVSSDMLLQLQKLGAPAHKLHHLVCGYNESLFQYTDHSNNPPVFFSAGRFCDTKNPHLTILAFSRVLQHIPDARLVMAGGDENLLNACVALTRSLNMERHVTFKGVLTPTQMAEEMKGAVALVQSSATTILGEKEGTPVTVLEAMAGGLPVVATRHAGISDVIEHEVTGLLTNEYDVEGMVANMILLATNKDLAGRMGKAAADKVKGKYSLSIYIQQLTEVLYRSIESYAKGHEA